MKFLIQHKIPQYDFEFELLRAQNYFEWKNGSSFEIKFEGDNGIDESYCPVGSVEFCRDHGITCSPRNIPYELEKYAYGGCVHKSVENDNEKYYFKSSTKIKDERNGVYSGYQGNHVFKDCPFQATRFLKDGFEAEWRCFIMDNRLLDIKQYSANDDEALFVVPNRNVVLNMIADFKSSPCAYTLDVGVTGLGNTHIIEVHDFFACGLYKFDDHRYLPAMLYNWYSDYMKSEKHFLIS